MDPEEDDRCGRPYGGVGFLCKPTEAKPKGLSFRGKRNDNERIAVLEIRHEGKCIVTVFGVYLPFYNGRAEQIGLYSETLSELQGLIDTCETPFLVVGDMNAPLPNHLPSNRKWHLHPPYTKHSMILHDFVMDNELTIVNHSFPQKVHHTYSKGGYKSYIDHVLCSENMVDSITLCSIGCDDFDNTSDHLPLVVKMELPASQGTEADITNRSNPLPVYPKAKWADEDVRASYKAALIPRLAEIHAPPLANGNAAEIVNSLCSSLTSAMHDAARSTIDARPRDPHRPRRHWWNDNCRIARDRHRFWFYVWKSCNRPRQGHVYECHKRAKEYRRACRCAVNSTMSRTYKALDALLSRRDVKQFWSRISSSRKQANGARSEISIRKLAEYYEKKFAPGHQHDCEAVAEAKRFVQNHMTEEDPDPRTNCTTSPSHVASLIRRLKLGRSAGGDGILAEHLVYGSCRQLHCLLSDLINLCITSCVVPVSFTQGILVPILKKAHLDPAAAENYRPITISTTFAKLLELHILDESHGHDFSDLQFGFIEGLGTDMAASAAHDIISHCNYRGSPVFACSLDAEGAFDSIPHPVLFRKCCDVIPRPLWRLLVTWYGRLTVQIKWGGQLSDEIMVLQGTRQGGLSSPFLFNIFYQDMIQDLNRMPSGLVIDDTNFNALCYADDVLLVSLTVTGLQNLIDAATKMIEASGLRFNPSKTVCACFGKTPVIPKWTLNGTNLRIEDEITYLGTVLSRRRNAHAEARIASCRRAFFSLQGAGLHPRGLSPLTVSAVWKAAVRPVLLYGAHCTYTSRTAIDMMNKTDTTLLKNAIGLRKWCRNTPLQAALGLRELNEMVDDARLQLLRSTVCSSKRAAKFYAYALTALHTGGPVDPRGAVGQAVASSSRMEVLRLVVTGAPRRPRASPEDNGLIDSVRQVLLRWCDEDRHLLELLLKPF